MLSSFHEPLSLHYELRSVVTSEPCHVDVSTTTLLSARPPSCDSHDFGHTFHVIDLGFPYCYEAIIRTSDSCVQLCIVFNSKRMMTRTCSSSPVCSRHPCTCPQIRPIVNQDLVSGVIVQPCFSGVPVGTPLTSIPNISNCNSACHHEVVDVSRVCLRESPQLCRRHACKRTCSLLACVHNTTLCYYSMIAYNNIVLYDTATLCVNVCACAIRTHTHTHTHAHTYTHTSAHTSTMSLLTSSMRSFQRNNPLHTPPQLLDNLGNALQRRNCTLSLSNLPHNTSAAVVQLVTSLLANGTQLSGDSLATQEYTLTGQCSPEQICKQQMNTLMSSKKNATANRPLCTQLTEGALAQCYCMCV